MTRRRPPGFSQTNIAVLPSAALASKSRREGANIGASRLNQLWSAFIQARALAERSNDIADGIRAGKAWAAFLHEFEAMP
jgi:hypothetical protein